MARRKVWAVIATMMVGLMVAAASAAAAKEVRLEAASLATGEVAPAAASPLFYRLPGSAVETLPSTARVEYRLDGRIEVLEIFDLRGQSRVPGQALELLAYDPGELARLRAKAAEGGHLLEVSIRLDGVLSTVLGVEDLLRSREEGGREALQPLAVRPRVVRPSSPSAPERGTPSLLTRGYVPDPNCLSSCWSAYESCASYYPECEEPMSDLCPCTEDYDSCVANCPQVCVDPKSVTPFTHYEVAFTWYAGTNCLWIGPFYDSWGYNFATRHTQVKVTTGSTIEHCDGTFTEQVSSVTYQHIECLEPVSTIYQCYPTAGQASNVCLP